MIFLVLLIVYVLITHYGLHSGRLSYCPLLVMLQALAVIGVSYILAAIGTYFRRQPRFPVPVFSVIGLYLMRNFLSPRIGAGTFRPVLYPDPFSYLIWCYQDALYFGQFEHWWAWPILVAMSMGSFCQRLSPFSKIEDHVWECTMRSDTHCTAGAESLENV